MSKKSKVHGSNTHVPHEKATAPDEIDVKVSAMEEGKLEHGPESTKLMRFKIEKFRDIWFLGGFFLNFLVTLVLCSYIISLMGPMPIKFIGLFFACFGTAVVTCLLIYLSLLFFPRFVSTFMYALPITALLACSIVFYIRGHDTLVLGLLYTSITVCFFLLLLLFENNNRLSKPHYSSLSRVFNANSSIFLFLGVCCVLTLSYMIFWGWSFLGSFNHLEYSFLYLTVSLYWITESIRYFVHTVTAGVVARHYLGSEEEKSKRNPTLSAIYVALTYTAGSTTLGALLMTPVTVIYQIMWLFGINGEDRYISACGPHIGGFFNQLSRSFHPYTLTWLSIYGDERSYMEAAHEVHDRVTSTAGLKRVERKSFPDRLIFLTIAGIAFVCSGIGLHVVGSVPRLSYSIYIELTVYSLFLGLVTMNIMLESIRGGIYASLICYMEDPSAVQRIDPELADHIQTISTRQEWVPQSPSAVDLTLKPEISENNINS